MEEFLKEILIPLHPKFVHFPIALMSAALFFEITSRIMRKDSIHKAAVMCYITAALSSIVTVCTGWFEMNRLHLHHPILNHHMTCAFTFMWSSLASLVIFRLMQAYVPRYSRTYFLIVVLVLTILALVTAYFGGKMVYQYGVGVAS